MTEALDIYNIQSLVGEGIAASYDDLAKYIARNLIRVELTFHRNRATVQIPGKQLGLKTGELGEKGQGFCASHLKGGVLKILPTEDERALNNLENQVRKCVGSVEISMGIVPYEKYRDEVRPLFQKCRMEIQARADDIACRWGILLRDFEEGARAMLDAVDMPPEARKSAMSQIMAQVPTAETFRNSFSASMNVTAFPATGVPEGMEDSVSEDLEESWKLKVVETAKVAIEKTIGRAFSLLGSAARGYVERESFSSSTMSAIGRMAEEITWRNVFGNRMLRDLEATLTELPAITKPAMRETFVESALAGIWIYGKENGLELDASETPFDAATLTAMARNLNG